MGDDNKQSRFAEYYIYRIVDDLKRALDADTEIVARGSITEWLMQFASGLPLRLSHPRMRNISLGGFKFSGSVIRVYDRYVLLTVEDLIEKHVRAFETAMEKEIRISFRTVAASGFIAHCCSSKTHSASRNS